MVAIGSKPSANANGPDMAMLIFEPERHRVAAPKMSAAFLRNSFHIRCWRKDVTEGSSATLKICEDAGPMPLVIGGGAGIEVGHSKAKGVVEQNGDLAGRGGDGLLLADTRAERRR